MKRFGKGQSIMLKYFKKQKISSLFCKTCSTTTPESIEEDMNRKFFPRICIGHVGLFIAGISIAIMELMR